MYKKLLAFKISMNLWQKSDIVNIHLFYMVRVRVKDKIIWNKDQIHSMKNWTATVPWVAPSVKHLTLDFGPCHDLGVMRSSPALGSAPSPEPA